MMGIDTVAASQWCGWAACVLTLFAFVSRDMLRLRLLALAANGAFVGYALLAGLTPVLVLHLVLAPVNLWRLMQLTARQALAET
jgi:hypothetical protein